MQFVGQHLAFVGQADAQIFPRQPGVSSAMPRCSLID